MIIEHARIRVAPGDEDAFAAAVHTARTAVLPQAQGFRGLTLHRCIEDPQAFICALTWDQLSDHTVAFREGALFQEWRDLVGGYFIEPPEVFHYSLS